MTFQSVRSWRILLFVVVGLLVFFLYLYFYVGTGNFVEVVREADPYLYASAFAASFAASFLSALTWRSMLDTLSIKTSVRSAFLLTWAGYFLDSTLPEPGWSGDMAKSYMLSKKSNLETAKVVASVVGQKIVGMGVTILLLVVGFGLLAANYSLPREIVVFFGVVMAVSVASFLIVYFMSRSGRATKAILERLLIPVLAFFLRGYFDKERFRATSEKFLVTFHEGIDMFAAHRWALLRPVGFYVLGVAFDILVVFLVFASLGYPIPIDRVLIVYALTGTLSSIGVSFVGLTEIVMSTAYQVLLIPLPVAFSVTLLTRIVTLWFKLVVGYVVFQAAGMRLLLRGRSKSV